MNDFIIGFCRHRINDNINQRKYRKGNQRADDEQRGAGKQDQMQKLIQHRKREGRMDPGKYKRQKK